MPSCAAPNAQSGTKGRANMMKSAIGILAAAVLAAAPAFARQSSADAPLLLAQAAQPTPQQRAAAIRQQLQASQAVLRGYEWIEMTVVSKDGEQTSRTQKRCYYGADAKLQKVVLEQTASQPRGGPLMRHLAEEKKKEMTEYMQRAAELIHSYVPPVPSLLQRAVDSGKLAVQVIEPGRRARLNFADYLKPGDTLGIEVELQTNRPLGITVSTYLDSRDDAITLGVTMATLADGKTIYVPRTQLDAKAKGVSVVVENSGYRRMAQ
jgi:hypothetical protein